MPRGARPASLSIEPTTSCNLRCPECPSGLRAFTRPTGMLDASAALSWIDEMAPWLTYVNLYFQGEPLLHPDLEAVVARCQKHGLYSSTSTNAHHLTPARATSLVRSGLSRLIVSIDGLTQETYSAYRVGGQLQKVMEGTRHVVEAKKQHGRGPHLVWQFLVVGPNEHELPDLLEAAKACGVDEVEVKTAQLDDPRDGHPLLTKSPQLRRYDRHPVTGAWTLRNALEDACWRMWQGTVLTWDGKAVPCCFDKDAQHVMGNMQTSTMAEIWHGHAYRSFRSALFADRSGIPMCTNCSEGSHVYA
jgi:MoaA/NifB/PqqE/SkfB family radical SAM enzyme